MQSGNEILSVIKTYYYMRNIIPEKSYAKCGGETNPRTFSKKLKLSFIELLFIVCLVKYYRNVLKLSSRALAFKAFCLKKREVSSPASFLNDI